MATSDLDRSERQLTGENESSKLLPFQLQLPVLDSQVGIVVSGRTKLDELGVVSISEAKFGRLVKASNNVVQVVDVLRLAQVVCGRWMSYEKSLTSEPRTLEEELGLHSHKDRTMEMTWKVMIMSKRTSTGEGVDIH